MLMDSAKIQQENAEYLNKKLGRAGQDKIEPLYTTEDAERTIAQCKALQYRRPLDLGGVVVELHDAGHTLGSEAMSLTETASRRVLVFTGDVGRPHSPILAAAFLETFAGEGPWAHLDIAGTAYLERGRGDYYSRLGATGYGVRLLTELARRLAT